MVPRLEVTDTLDDGAEEKILAELKAHNDVLFGAPSDRRGLYVPIRDEAGTVIGGLTGYTGRGFLHVEMLFIPEGMRGKRLAGRLLESAEIEAKARGCVGAYIDTANPDARRAYQRQGYEIIGTLADYPPGFSITWMAKRF
jgi:GNAT superfamily N-acetyltransferase